ncbi:ribosome-binding ATPase YchF [Spirochaetia bacterium]|nr:ribosome-binding ATPase YchF [Spirochaetia bacterium]
MKERIIIKAFYTVTRNVPTRIVVTLYTFPPIPRYNAPMALNCGIVGLPNVGKSTIFSALSSAPAEAANYPFCTINPNVGIVDVPDERLLKLSALFKPERTIPAAVEFVDIAGLVKGASRGEGLGNQFLSHIREVGVIAQVVRCFDDPDIVHVSNKVDPESDMETINVELALADLDTLSKRRERAERALKVQAKAEQKIAETVLTALDKIGPLLEAGKPARSANLSDDERAAVYDCHFVSAKPQLYVCNVDEETMKAISTGKNVNAAIPSIAAMRSIAYIDTVKQRAAAEGSEAVIICGKFEAELADIDDPAEKLAFLEELGLADSGLGALVHAAYRLLGLQTFFTCGSDECRAWTVHGGDTAPKAAGVIHTDFEKGFIKAEVYSYEDIIKYGSEAKIKEAGKYRIEGKEYILRDGDVMFFKFNV